MDYIPPAGSSGSLLGRMHPCHSSNGWSCLVYVILCSRDPVVYTLRRFLPPVCYAMMRSASSDLSPQAAVRSRTFKQRARYATTFKNTSLIAVTDRNSSVYTAGLANHCLTVNNTCRRPRLYIVATRKSWSKSCDLTRCSRRTVINGTPYAMHGQPLPTATLALTN